MKTYRWIAIASVWLVTFVAYLDRVNLSVSATSIMGQFGFSATQIGLFMSAMIPGYVILNFISGYLVDRYAPLKVIGTGMVIWSLCTAWFAYLSNFSWMLFSRVIFGAAEGMFAPGQTKLYANWALPEERGRALSGSVATSLLGVAVGAPFCGLIVKAYGWQTLFVICALFGLAYTVILSIMARTTPTEHPWVTPGEKELIEKAHEDERIKRSLSSGKVATKKETYDHLKNPHVWLLALGYLTVMCIWWALLSWLPGYFVKEKGFTVFQSGIMSSFPYFMGVIGVVCGGFITDKIPKVRRSVYVMVSEFIAPVAVFIALGATANVGTIIGFSVAMFLIAGAMGQLWAMSIDLFSVKMAGISAGILSGVGYFGGLCTPVLMGRVYDVTNSFYWGFGSVALITALGGIIAIPLLRYENKVKMLGQLSKDTASAEM